MEPNQQPLLEVSDLSVSFQMYRRGLTRQRLQVISSLSLSVYPGEILAVAGSSGSGKSLLASAILGILPDNAWVEGRLSFDGRPLTPDRQAELRGGEIALVPQSVAFLDPLMKVGEQVRKGRRDPASREKSRRVLESYGLPEVAYFLETFMDSFSLTLDELK